MTTGSVTLHHGPGAESLARQAARDYGLVVPFKASEVLKKSEARDLVSLLSQTPVGDRPWGVVVGPVDEISPAVGDVLLKTIEEFVPSKIRPFLWAWDYGGVLPTLRSRTVQTFVPGVDERVSLCRPQADKLLRSYILRNWSEIVSDLKDFKGDERFVFLALAEAILERLSSGDGDRNEILKLWGSLRSFLSSGDAPSTPARVLAVFLVGV